MVLAHLISPNTLSALHVNAARSTFLPQGVPVSLNKKFQAHLSAPDLFSECPFPSHSSSLPKCWFCFSESSNLPLKKFQFSPSQLSLEDLSPSLYLLFPNYKSQVLPTWPTSLAPPSSSTAYQSTGFQTPNEILLPIPNFFPFSAHPPNASSFPFNMPVLSLAYDPNFLVQVYLYYKNYSVS